NELACRLAEAASSAYLEKLAERHNLEPAHAGAIALSGGSDDHGALDIATTFTEAPGETVADFLAAVRAGLATQGGAHGSSVKLAHAVVSLAANAYRDSGAEVSHVFAREALALLDDDPEDPARRHRELADLGCRASRLLGGQARAGALEASGV